MEFLTVETFYRATLLICLGFRNALSRTVTLSCLYVFNSKSNETYPIAFNNGFLYY